MDESINNPVINNNPNPAPASSGSPATLPPTPPPPPPTPPPTSSPPQKMTPAVTTPETPSETFIVKSQSTSKFQASQLSSKVKLVLPIVAIIILIIAGAAGAFIIKDRQSTKQAANVTPFLKKVSSTPSPAKLVSEEEIKNVSEIITPWGYAGNDLPSEPAKPTLQELETIYNSMKKAAGSRDKTTLAKFLAKERLWLFENPKQLKGETPSGQKVFIRVKPISPEDNLPELLYLAPGIEETTAVNIEEKPKPNLSASAEGFMLIDEDTKKVEFVSKTPWRYTIEASFKTKPEAKKTGEGKVTFVFDQDSWKYYGEIWDLNPSESPNSYGDSLGEEKVHEIINSGTTPPEKILKIKVGEAVTWKNIKGLIYTYRTTADHWNSPFLLGDQYIKVFRSVGVYYYRIISSGSAFEGEIYVE